MQHPLEIEREWLTLPARRENTLPEGECPYCGEQMDKGSFLRQPTKEHIVPQRAGGRATIIVCYECNNAKGGMMPGEWLWYVREVRPHRLEHIQALFLRLGITDVFSEPRFWRGMPEADRLARVEQAREAAATQRVP